MPAVTAVIVGGGPAGLAMSRSLSDLDVDHVVLERAAVAHAWRTARWDSMRMLTPNWMNVLPGLPYDGNDPDGFETATAMAERLETYSRLIAAPVHEGVAVTAVTATCRGRHPWTVDTDAGRWHAAAVILATGATGPARRPMFAAELRNVAQIDSGAYRNPDHLPAGAVLVVGASASGVQIASELAAAGRDVTIAVGEHVRVPRMYRGRDIHWWMCQMGLADERWDEVADIARARRVPSPQLIGTPDRRDLGLNELRAAGVRVVGRAVGVRGGRLQCSGSLANLIASADLKMRRLLDTIDRYAERISAAPMAADRPHPTTPTSAPTEMDLRGVAAVVWAIGSRPVFPHLAGVRLERGGEPAHAGGIGEAPGLYLLGQRFQRRRASSFLYGMGADARDLAGHLRDRLDQRRSVA